MGQTLRTISDKLHPDEKVHLENSQLPDLAVWPPELSLNVLKNLNATDLCLAACVWSHLAKDKLLWQSLCYSQWGYTSIYHRTKPPDFSYHKLYLTLDEASITFNADCRLGMEYFIDHGLIEDNPAEIAQLFFRAKPLDRSQVRIYLQTRIEVLDHLVQLLDFSGQSLPDALRQYFTVLEAPNKYDRYLHLMVEKFSHRFVACNSRRLNHSPETIYVLCFSLIMLSVDLTTPHIKNKMSKREFIRNVRRALRVTDDELYGHLYDDVYLRGHIALSSSSWQQQHQQRAHIIRSCSFQA